MLLTGRRCLTIDHVFGCRIHRRRTSGCPRYVPLALRADGEDDDGEAGGSGRFIESEMETDVHDHGSAEKEEQ